MHRLFLLLLLLCAMAAPPAVAADKQALQKAQAQVKLHPGDAAAQHALGVALKDQKRYREAEGPLRAALKLNGKNVQYYLDLAEVLYYLKRYDEGEAVLQRAAAAFPKDGSVYYYQGAYRLARGRKQEALALLEKAVALKPSLKKEIREDDDLAALRQDKRFRKLTGG